MTVHLTRSRCTGCNHKHFDPPQPIDTATEQKRRGFCDSCWELVKKSKPLPFIRSTKKQQMNVWEVLLGINNEQRTD